MCFFLFTFSLGKPYSPGGFPLRLIDSRTCTGLHVWNIGWSRASPTVSSLQEGGSYCMCAQRDWCRPLFCFSLTVSCAFTHSLCCISGLCFTGFIVSLGISLYFSCHKHFRWPLIPYCKDSTFTCWNVQSHISCQPSLPELLGKSARSHHWCSWHKKAGVHSKCSFPHLPSACG